MPQYTEREIEAALTAVFSGLSIRAAAKKYAIPLSTLYGRYQGASSRKEAFQHLQALQPVQESLLAKWVLTQEALGVPPTHAQVAYLGQRVLTTSGSAEKLGRDWVQGFLRRNQCLQTKRGKKMEQARINGATPEIISDWFKWLQTPEVAAIKPENRWNMDEAGIMEGMGSNGLVLGCKGARGVVQKMPGNKAWTSFIECISATGEAIPPLVIFKGKSVQQQWFPAQLKPHEGWKFEASDNGWTSNDIALAWLRELFLKKTKPQDPKDYRLLIFDGHGSHETPEFMWECFTNKVLLVYLPPHTSHVLQPLDLAVFSALKKAYRRLVSDIAQWSDSTVLGKRLFLGAYRQARLEALSVKNIKSGWIAGGLWPICANKPLTSPLLLVNSSVGSRDLAEADEDSWEDIRPITPTKAFSELSLSTPVNNKELLDRLRYLQGSRKVTRSVKRVQRQVLRMWNRETFERAISDRKVEGLEAKIEDMRPRTRKRVVVGPNQRFATIKDVQQAQIAAGSVVDGPILESDTESVSSEGSCIVVRTRAATRKVKRAQG
jgi:hypothetical protein